MQGGPSGHGPDRNELLLKRVRRSNDFIKVVIPTMANYTSGSSFTIPLPHLKGKEVLGSSKQFANCLFGIDNDSHHLDCVNFSCPLVIILVTEPNIVDDVNI